MNKGRKEGSKEGRKEGRRKEKENKQEEREHISRISLGCSTCGDVSSYLVRSIWEHGAAQPQWSMLFFQPENREQDK